MVRDPPHGRRNSTVSSRLICSGKAPSSLVSRPHGRRHARPHARTTDRSEEGRGDSRLGTGRRASPNPNAEQTLARQALTVLSRRIRKRLWRAMLGKPFAPQTRVVPGLGPVTGALSRARRGQASGEGPRVSRSNSGLPRSWSKSDSSGIRPRRLGSRSSATASESSALVTFPARLQ